MRFLSTAVSAIFLTATVSHVQAAPIDWVFSDVVLADGGQITGGFTFDAATTSYTDILIERSVGSTQEAQTFTALTPAASVTPRADFVIFVSDAADLTGSLFLQLILDSELGEPGVPTGIFTGGSGTGRCAAFDCSLVVPTGASFVTAGQLEPAASPLAPVPLPASGVLFFAALAGLFGFKGRNKTA
ncbi:MAG: hypothetical protein ABJ251_16825 [Paracoccaceae bacterium]